MYKLHSSLLIKSFPLLYLPTIHEALDGKLPIDNTSHQKKFLIDFIQKNPGTSGGRLAVLVNIPFLLEPKSWLQPEPYLDPKNCKVACAKKDLFCGWPCLIFIQARDQYGCPADLSNLKLEAKAILMLKSTSNYKLNYLVSNNSVNCGSPCFGGHPPPKLEVPYHPSVREKKEIYHSITMMKEFEIYSFEELRFSTSMIMKPTENMSIKNELDGSYTASWNPNSAGFYDILITVDGIRIGEPLKILIKEAPHENFPQLSNPLKNLETKPYKQSRQFICKQSAGLRIRLHPSLQSEQIGILENNAIISFTTQLQNDDGTWLKLSPDTMRKCHLPYNGSNEGWALQYHQHLRKTFLFPVQDKNKENIYNNFTSKVSSMKNLKEKKLFEQNFPKTFVASKCGPHGHKILKSPKIDSTTIGKITQGTQISAVREKKTNEGVWLELNDKCKDNYCFNQSEEAWCLAESCVGDIFFTCFKRNHRCLKNDVVINNTNIEEHSEDNFNSRKKNGESQINGNGITPPATPKKTLLKATEECNRHCDSNLNDRQIEATSKMNFILRKVIKVSTENQSRSNSCSPPRSNNLYKKLRSSSMPARDVSFKGFSVLVPRDHKNQKEKVNSEKGNLSPAVPEIPIVSTKTPTNKVMSPSLAECLRAMFAAFLWHKDIVQDAMACASFLKFHPTYVKDSIDLSDKSSTEEYYQDPKGIEQNGLKVVFNSFKKSHTNFMDSLTPEKPHIPKLSTLVHLLFFWDQLNIATIKAIEESFKLTMPTDNSEHLFLKKSDNDNFEWLENVSLQNPSQKSTNKENPCDLCGISFSPPITYHMRQFHPGCGKNAGGQGYNSEGAYCDGWAGKCGDGGKHTSTWYLMCASCKEYYHSKWQGSNNLEIQRNSKNPSKAERKNSPTFCLAQIFTMLKNNALFILDLNFFNSSMKSEFETPENDDCIFKCSPSQMPFIFLDICKLNNNSIQREHIDIKSNGKNNERNHTGERPRSIYEGYKFDMSHASTTLYNLNFMRETEYSNEFQFPFHRSISEMGPTLGREGNRQNLKNETFLKEGKTSKGLSLLNHPSLQLSSMIQSMNKWMNCNDKPFFEYILEQPFMKFCIQSHDLEHLVSGIKLALCKATCRTYALQAFNWLMRKVTLQSCLHDLLWYFVSSLMLQPYEMKLVQQQENLNKGRQSDFECDVEVICRHPLDDIPLAEGLSKVVIYCFHTFLQSLSDIMMFLPKGTSVQQMAVKCWSLKFKPSDHEFLHQSDIFKSISKILSESEQTSSELYTVDYMLFVETLRDLTLLMEINVSTHQQMLSSITDYSTETFWESGDDDRNKIKTISFIFNDECVPQLVCVYVDNVKDHGNKVSSVLVSSGLNHEEVQMDAQQEFDLRHVGWMNIWLNKKKRNCIKLAVKGPDSSLRIRQVKLLGHIVTSGFENNSGLDSYELQCLNCETETLRVFKFLTTQVFKSLIISEDNCDERHVTGKMEHVVGILFSQQKLTNMQKQVCAHILHAIKKETVRVREAWEFSKITEFSDNYCFELLNLVLALSGSTAGCAFVAQQLCLLEDLLTLLHTSSARVQRQVVLLLRRLLVHVEPGTFAKVQNISISDFETIVDYRSNFMEHVGIMDVFLICIVKCLSVQIKKCKTVIDSTPFSDYTSFSDVICSKVIPLKWWYNGSASTQLAELVITLLKDISDGKLTEEWAAITKNAIAEPILILSQMPEEYRSCDICIRTPVLWLTLASLCVLNEEHMSHFSPSSLPSSVPENFTCDNHDDGYTVAIMKCSVCGDLCAECDRVLHLSRKTKIHQRHIFVEEKEIVKVDCLEGCGRIKLFWILASSDSRNLKAVIEFRDEDSYGWPHIRSNHICRFCGIFFINDTDTNTQVCKSPECFDMAKKACLKILACGHLCGGIRDELPCLPCLHGCKNQEMLLLKQDADDMCMICFSDTLSRAPSIQLACGHVFHMHCCEKILLSKWTGPRITFGFSLCPICKAPICHSSLNALLKPIKDRFDDVKRKALMRLEYEGLSCSESIVTPGFTFYNDPAGYAMHRYAYYVCSKCDKAYFGGEVRCEDQAIGGPQAAEGYDVSELVCGACSDISRAQICPKHGVDFLEYKCRYCCSVAVFFCFGTTHFCSSCHDDFQRITTIPINDLPHCPAGPKTRQLEGQCPLAVVHPSTGTEFALGCGVCRNAHTF